MWDPKERAPEAWSETLCHRQNRQTDDRCIGQDASTERFAGGVENSWNAMTKIAQTNSGNFQGSKRELLCEQS